MRRVPAGAGGNGWTGLTAASISSWKISGSPVTHSISRNAVQTRLDHLWTRNQPVIARRVTGQKRRVTTASTCRGAP